MKFSIKIKIVALGAVLSILVMTTALIFANVQYRRHGEQATINVVDEWLTVMKGDLENEDFGEEYLNDLK
ncbi:hypothetical protein ELJ01_31465, partial [Klebsiella pneumoniae]|nr:hypothetical protein [Klebsiella pneumoniae]